MYISAVFISVRTIMVYMNHNFCDTVFQIDDSIEKFSFIKFIKFI